MPHPTNPPANLAFQRYQTAWEVPDIAVQAMEARAVQANHILPFLLKCRSGEVQDVGNSWFVVRSLEHPSQVLYIAACTTTALGDYPLFIFTTIPYMELTHDVVGGDMRFLSQHLHAYVRRERLYSVFAVDRITEAFSKEWFKLTGIEPYRKPFYDCTGSFCTPRDLKPRRTNTVLSTGGIDYEVRLAHKGDIGEIAVLCELFAQESEPFVMTPSHARLEATTLVERNAVWVHRIRRSKSDAWEIASITACTRNTAKVATITKVYTNPKWRRLGCAERLVREVCKHLFSSGKEKVALFVGNDNPATIVYDKVGFIGLGRDEPRVEGVDRWLEIGFDKRFVRQGHW